MKIMKTSIYAFSISMCCLFFSHLSFAQSNTRPIDLQVSISSPANGEVIPNGGSTMFNLQFKNNSNDTLKSSDTFAIKFVGFDVFNNSIPSNQWAKFNVNSPIPPQANVTLDLGGNNNTITNNRQAITDTTFTACVTITTVFDAVGDTLASNFRETDTTNNTSCFEITFKGGTVSIKNINEAPIDALTIFPNPNTTGAFSMDYSLSARNEVRVRIMDLTGRKIFDNNLGIQYAGNHKIDVDLSQNIAAGTYLVELTTGEHRKVTKLIINK
jgi:hypothetical protein